jgi:hypothetical protein
MRSLRRVIALLLTATACSDSNDLPDPTLTNVERSETLHALVGTPVSTPSAYALEGSRRVRTDLSSPMDARSSSRGRRWGSTAVRA